MISQACLYCRFRSIDIVINLKLKVKYRDYDAPYSDEMHKHDEVHDC
jgi:hypothetical protein